MHHLNLAMNWVGITRGQYNKIFTASLASSLECKSTQNWFVVTEPVQTNSWCSLIGRTFHVHSSCSMNTPLHLFFYGTWCITPYPVSPLVLLRRHSPVWPALSLCYYRYVVLWVVNYVSLQSQSEMPYMYVYSSFTRSGPYCMFMTRCTPTLVFVDFALIPSSVFVHWVYSDSVKLCNGWCHTCRSITGCG